MEEFDLARIKKLAGLSTGAKEDGAESPFTHGAADKGEYMKKHKIEPGSNDWFKLWSAHPKLSGENPFGQK
jgi:hypothetical protein